MGNSNTLDQASIVMEPTAYNQKSGESGSKERERSKKRRFLPAKVLLFKRGSNCLRYIMIGSGFLNLNIYCCLSHEQPFLSPHGDVHRRRDL